MGTKQKVSESPRSNRGRLGLFATTDLGVLGEICSLASTETRLGWLESLCIKLGAHMRVRVVLRVVWAARARRQTMAYTAQGPVEVVAAVAWPRPLKNHPQTETINESGRTERQARGLAPFRPHSHAG